MENIKSILEEEVDSWGRAYKIVERRKRETGWLVTRLKENGEWMEIANETINELVKKYFVLQVDENEEEKQAVIRTDTKKYLAEIGEDTDYIPKVTKEEVREIMKNIKKNKATSKHGLDYRQVKMLVERQPDIVCNLLSRCLCEGRWINEWKRARIVWIPKNDGGVRPIILSK